MPKYSWEGKFGFPVKLPGRVVPLEQPCGSVGDAFEIPLALDVRTWEQLVPVGPHGPVRVTLQVEAIETAKPRYELTASDKEDILAMVAQEAEGLAPFTRVLDAIRHWRASMEWLSFQTLPLAQLRDPAIETVCRTALHIAAVSLRLVHDIRTGAVQKAV